MNVKDGFFIYDLGRVHVLLDGKGAGSTPHRISIGSKVDLRLGDVKPDYDDFYERLGSFDRIVFDKTLDLDEDYHVLQINLSTVKKAEKTTIHEEEDMLLKVVQYPGRRISFGAMKPAYENAPYELEITEDGLSYKIHPGHGKLRLFFTLMSSSKGSLKDIVFFSLNPNKLNVERIDRSHFRLIGGNRRFGNGYLMEDEKKVYYAFYGFPDRNDDYFYNAEITEEEFGEIEKEFDGVISEDYIGDFMDFYRKYIEGHRILLEGWGRLF